MFGNACSRQYMPWMVCVCVCQLSLVSAEFAFSWYTQWNQLNLKITRILFGNPCARCDTDVGTLYFSFMTLSLAHLDRNECANAFWYCSVCFYRVFKWEVKFLQSFKEFAASKCNKCIAMNSDFIIQHTIGRIIPGAKSSSIYQ